MRLPHRWAAATRDALWTPDADRLDRFAFLLLLAFVVASPWMSRTVLPARLAGGLTAPLGALLIPGIAFIIGVTTFLSRSTFRTFRPLTIPASALLALTLFGVLQVAPLPDSVLGRIAPVNQQIYHEMAEIVAVYGRPEAPTPRISIAPWDTIATLLRIGGYGTLLLSSWALLRQRPRRRFFVAVLLICATAQVLLAATAGARGRPSPGALPIREGFATYLAVLLALAFGSVWAEVLTNADRGRDAADRAERLTERITPLVVRALFWLAIAAGNLIARTPLATASAAASTLLLTVLAFGRRDRLHSKTSRTAIAIGLGALAASCVMALPLTPAGEAPGRTVAIWRASVEAWRMFPVAGAGFGAFPDAIRRAQPRELIGLVENARSDGLQLLVTGGVVGALLGLVAFLSLMVVLARRWRAQVHREESAIALAGIGALVGFGLDGLVTFNLGAPATLATLACILGLTLAAGSNAAGGSRSNLA